MLSSQMRVLSLTSPGMAFNVDRVVEVREAVLGCLEWGGLRASKICAGMDGLVVRTGVVDGDGTKGEEVTWKVAGA